MYELISKYFKESTDPYIQLNYSAWIAEEPDRLFDPVKTMTWFHDRIKSDHSPLKNLDGSAVEEVEIGVFV